MSVHSHSLVSSPILHIPCMFYILLYLLSWVCHSMLCHWLSLTWLEILCTILPHAVNSSHCLHRPPPAGDELPQLAPALCLEIISQHKSHGWSTAPADSPSLTDKCHLYGAAQCYYMTWCCHVTNMEHFANHAHWSNTTRLVNLLLGMPLITSRASYFNGLWLKHIHFQMFILFT